MPVGTIDEKWRVTIPKEARKSMRLLPRMPVNVKLKKDSIVIMPLHKGADKRRGDSLTWLLNNPAHVNPKKLKALDLNNIEDEMW
ncbi:MAG: AbrB/MazE/SpoVT family DNA-binding domain-containing protein [Candidatus Aenigmarchaeota archaeon]|nr:AbrB/MazE/SpoVT family DNA-binding domain-containing protein [Candidatus Aenigmarchaeota archaeon]